MRPEHVTTNAVPGSLRAEPKISIEVAQRVAVHFKRDPKCLGVEVFGSVARAGIGRNLNLIFIVNERTFRRYARSLKRMLNGGDREDVGDRQLTIRKVALKRVIPSTRTALDASMNDIKPDLLDIVVLPEGWRTREHELLRILDFKDGDFLHRLSIDAKSPDELTAAA